MADNNDQVDLDQITEDFISLEDLTEESGSSKKNVTSSSKSNYSIEDLVSLDNLDNIELTSTERSGAKGKTVAAADSDLISLDALDSLLTEEDPTLSGKLKDIGKDLNEGDHHLDLLDLDQVLSSEQKQNLAISFRNRCRLWFKSIPSKIKGSTRTLKQRVFLLVSTGYDKSYEGIEYFIKTGHKNLFAKLKEHPKKIWVFSKTKINYFAELSRIDKTLLIAIPILILSIGYLARKSLHKGWVPTTYEPYLSSFERVANRVYQFESTEAFEPFDSPLRHPDYTVLYDKLVVNLKRNQRSSSVPMGAFELYIEGSSKETAIELKVREKAIIDLIERNIETFSYDELDSDVGKRKLKLVLRKEINSLLNNGWIKRVYFKTFIIKP